MLAVSEEATHPRTKSIPATAKHRYFRIELYGQVDQSWVVPFDPVSFSSSEGVTRLEVRADQAGLRGFLNHLWDLNLDIFAVVENVGPTIQNGGS